MGKYRQYINEAIQKEITGGKAGDKSVKQEKLSVAEAKKLREESCKKAIEEWLEISTTPRPFDELMEYVYKDARTGDTKDNCRVCYSYICQYYQFSEDEIETLMVVTSNLYQHIGLTELDNSLKKFICRILSKPDADYQMNILAGFIKSKISKNYPIFSSGVKLVISSGKFPKKGYTDRLDWYNIAKYQNISESFREKYKLLIGRISVDETGSVIMPMKNPKPERVVVHDRKYKTKTIGVGRPKKKSTMTQIKNIINKSSTYNSL